MNEPDSRKPWWDGDYVWRPEGSDPVPDDPKEPEVSDPDSAPMLVQCWRCTQAVADTCKRCPYCRARLRHSRGPEEEDKPSASGTSGLVPLIWFFIALLCVSLIQAFLLHAI